MVCCWAPVIEAGRALDIGTGSGLVALMLAQRMHGVIPIEAVELDPDACRQARDNFAASPWARSLCVVEGDICAYVDRALWRYKMIVSNPPYFDVGPACATPVCVCGHAIPGA
nr:methyltransferase [Sodalis glossinidius]